MVSVYNIKGETTKKQVENAKKEGLNFLLEAVNSDFDHTYFFETQEEAEKHAINHHKAHPDFIEEKCTIWDLNDEMSNEVLFEQ